MIKLEIFRKSEDGVETVWVDKTAPRMVAGLASTASLAKPVARENQISLNPMGCNLKLPLPLLFEHGFIQSEDGWRRGYRRIKDAAIGDVVWLEKSAKGLAFRAVIHDTLAGDAAWLKIASGEARAVSVLKSADSKMAGIVDGNQYYDEWSVEEISICRQGANSDCHCQMWQGHYEKVVSEPELKKGAIRLTPTKKTTGVNMLC